MNRVLVLCSAFISLAALNLQADDDRFSDLEESAFEITPASSNDTKENLNIKKKVLNQNELESGKGLSLPEVEKESILRKEVSDYGELNEVINHKNSNGESFSEENTKLFDDEAGSRSKEKNFSLPKNNNANLIYLFLGLTASGVLFLVWWYQKNMKKKLQGAGISVSVLGQTWIDGSTRIILLKVGPKIITLAKSNQFCTTLDIISDPEEVNFLTLSSNMQQEAGSEFKQAFTKAKRQAFKPKSEKIPNASEMKMELEDLKKQLGEL